MAWKGGLIGANIRSGYLGGATKAFDLLEIDAKI